ncbi:nucleolar complex protein 4-like protein [Senna tora]|uniref:Nucleolar complex protein 4-like protein n=1 Tax=Senna tora TaxID=362788 RepID=A0A834WEK7_9FABA|nr:nucleolar complex protein 4-like protein [Senna tora]
MASKKKSKTSLSDVKTLGRQLLSSRAHINNLPLLLSFVSPTSPPQYVLESLLSLQSFFLTLLPDLPSSSSTALDASNHDPELIYRAWVRSKFDDFIKSLIDVSVSQQSDETLKEVVLDSIMEFAKLANGGKFHSAIYHRLLNSIVYSSGPVALMVDLLESKYFRYIDVRYFTYISLEKIARTMEGKDISGTRVESADGTDESPLNSSLEHVINNLYYIISHVSPLQGWDNPSSIEMWSESGFLPNERDCKKSSKDVDVDDNQQKTEKQNSNVASSAKITKKMKLKFTKAWTSYLRLPLPLDVYKEVLVSLHQAVIPHLSNPLMLCDFLTRSYDVGGVVSVMALSSLFILMTQYGLEYPNFYEKLYALLVPSIFMAKHRAKFLQLLDSCLKSPLLPAYLAASFAKKLSRLLLSVSPSGALVIIALIHNLLRRHPSINCLVDRVDDSKNGAVPGQTLGIDHFNNSETNPMKSNAMRVPEEGRSDELVEGLTLIVDFIALLLFTTIRDTYHFNLMIISGVNLCNFITQSLVPFLCEVSIPRSVAHCSSLSPLSPFRSLSFITPRLVSPPKACVALARAAPSFSRLPPVPGLRPPSRPPPIRQWFSAQDIGAQCSINFFIQPHQELMHSIFLCLLFQFSSKITLAPTASAQGYLLIVTQLIPKHLELSIIGDYGFTIQFAIGHIRSELLHPWSIPHGEALSNIFPQLSRILHVRYSRSQCGFDGVSPQSSVHSTCPFLIILTLQLNLSDEISWVVVRRSSLWEIDTILQHYCPPVSRQVFALSLENDLTVRAKTTEMNVGDFSSGSYATVFREEIRRRVKQVPLAFFKATPSSLFPDTDFAGWSFKLEKREAPQNDENTTRDISDHGSSPAKRQRK